MLPAGVKTEVWRELMEMLAQRLNVPAVCGQAVFGKLSFFQELRNRKKDDPYAPSAGIRYVSVPFDDAVVHVGPFQTSEPCTFDEELADARVKLPRWKDHYQELIEIAVSQAAIAGRSQYVMGDSLSRVKLLLEFAQETSQAKDSERALQATLQFLLHKFKLSNVCISAWGKKARQFDISTAGLAVEQRVIAQMKETKMPVTIQNVSTDFLLNGIKDRESLPQCIIGFPLVKDREWGGYTIVYAEHIPSLERIAEVLYELINVLFRLAQYEAVQVTAETDQLTGLSNRVTLSKNIDKLLKQLSGKDEPVSVLMADVDNFKQFNDTRGHPEGDKLLRSIGDVLRAVMPRNALCCRYGGEEFVVILANAGQDRANEYAEQFRAQVEAVCGSTMSIGVMTCMNSSASWETLIKEADRALYRAKNLGKNKVVSFLMLDKHMGVIDTI